MNSSESMRAENEVSFSLPILVVLAAGVGAANAIVGCTPPSPGLPALVSSAICGEEVLATPSLCEWAAATECIVWGEITRLEMTTEDPRWPNGQRAQSCPPGGVNPALELGLSVKRVISGSDPGKSLTLRYSPEVLEYWEPKPILGDDGALTFIGDDAKTNRLVVGQQLGVVLHRVGDELTSIVEPFFIEDEKGVRFSTARNLCGLAPPQETQSSPPQNLDQLSSIARSCDASDRALVRASDMRAFPFDCCHPICIEEAPADPSSP